MTISRAASCEGNGQLGSAEPKFITALVQKMESEHPSAAAASNNFRSSQ